jgi:hypothetical protein
MTPIHIADAQAAKRAQDAIRDILYLYRDLVEYGGVVGDHDLGAFEPWEFLQASVHGGWATDDDMRLLHEGSAVALVCDLMDEMDQRSGDSQRFRRALEAGLLDELPVAKETLQAGLAGTRELQEASKTIYREYVLGYFSTLVR